MANGESDLTRAKLAIATNVRKFSYARPTTPPVHLRSKIQLVAGITTVGEFTREAKPSGMYVNGRTAIGDYRVPR